MISGNSFQKGDYRVEPTFRSPGYCRPNPLLGSAMRSSVTSTGSTRKRTLPVGCIFECLSWFDLANLLTHPVRGPSTNSLVTLSRLSNTGLKLAGPVTRNPNAASRQGDSWPFQHFLKLIVP